MITLHDLADIRAIDRLVGDYPDKRWGRGSVYLRRSNGESVIEWFERHNAEERVRMVRRPIMDRAPWGRFRRVEIPKPGTTSTRPIEIPSVVDAARAYRLYDVLLPEVEKRLSRVAIGYRPLRSLESSVRSIQAAMEKLHFAVAVDVERFFETIPWVRLDRVSESLPAASTVVSQLEGLVRAGADERTAGIAQGLSTSPLLANLYLAEFDRVVSHALSKLPGRLWRYSDNILALLADAKHGQHAFEIVRDRIEREGLRLKETQAVVVNVAEEGLEWLGLRIFPERVEVPDATVEKKATLYRAELDAGLRSVWSTLRRLANLENYYGKLTSPAKAMEISTRIREIIDLPQGQGKEKNTQIRVNTRDRSSKGHGERSILSILDGTSSPTSHLTPWKSILKLTIRPTVSKSPGLPRGAPVCPAPRRQRTPVVSARVFSRLTARVEVDWEPDRSFLFRRKTTCHSEIEMLALAEGVRSIGSGYVGGIVLRPTRHAFAYLVGHKEARAVRMVLARRALLAAVEAKGGAVVYGSAGQVYQVT